MMMMMMMMMITCFYSVASLTLSTLCGLVRITKPLGTPTRLYPSTGARIAGVTVSSPGTTLYKHITNAIIYITFKIFVSKSIILQFPTKRCFAVFNMCQFILFVFILCVLSFCRI